MKRLVLARALGLFLDLLALTMLWNGIDGFRYARGAVEYTIGILQILSAPALALSAYGLWRRDPRAVLWCGISMAFSTVVGTMAATYWSEPSEKMSAGLGALGASIVLLIAVVWLARVAVRAPSNDTTPQDQEPSPPSAP